MKTLGERIREIREAKDISLRELSLRIRVTPAFMSDIELGRRFPSDKNLLAIAYELDIDTEDLKQFDSRPPLQEFRKATHTNPEYGFAFRQLLQSNMTPEELVKLVEDWSAEKGRKGKSRP